MSFLQLRSPSVSNNLAYTPSISTLVDTLAVYDSSKWAKGGADPNSVVFVSNSLQITVASATNYFNQLQSVDKYNWANSGAYIRVAMPAISTVVSEEAGLQFVINDQNLTWLFVGNGQLKAYYKVNNVQAQIGSITYDPVNHAYIRIREAGSIWYYDTSPDGITWTNQFTNPGPFSGTKVGYARIYATHWQSEATTTTDVFYNFNTNVPHGPSSYITYSSTDTLKRKSGITTYHSSDALKKKTYSIFSTTDAYRDNRSYSRANMVSLPTNDADLATLYTLTDKTTVATVDGLRVNQTGSGFNIHEFKSQSSNVTSGISFTWTGRSTIASTTSPVYLQIYNRTSGLWETLASNTTAAANTDMTLTGSQSTNLTNYYSANGYVSGRLYQEMK